MRLVLASLHLSWLGGATTYLLTIAPALQQLGHDVTLYSPDAGETAEIARDRGIAVATRESELPRDCDAVVAQDTALALELRALYSAPQVFVSHGAEFAMALPPQVEGASAAVVAMNDRVVERLRAAALETKVVRLRQPIDIGVFCPRGPIRERPEEVLLLGNYMTGHRRDVVTRVCDELGLRHSQVGRGATMSPNPSDAIGRADIVIGYGRSVLEAMACGRAAYVLDYLGGDGWVTADRYPTLERDGFAGSAFNEPVAADRLRRDLLAYDPQMGPVNQGLVMTHHTVFEHARQLAVLLKSATDTAHQRLTSGRELARLVRLQWHSDWRAGELWREVESLRAQLHEQERRARDAERRFEALTSTRRWRSLQRALRPLDLLRRRPRGGRG